MSATRDRIGAHHPQSRARADRRHRDRADGSRSFWPRRSSACSTASGTPRRCCASPAAAVRCVAGAAFAIAWTPCTSITLSAILTQAAISGSAAHGALLLAFYSAGLAIPFLLIALAFERMTNALTIVKRHFPVIIGIGGAVMIVLGVLILTGDFTILNAKANALLQGTGLNVSNI